MKRTAIYPRPRTFSIHKDISVPRLLWQDLVTRRDVRRLAEITDIIMQLKQACLDAVLEDEGVRKSAKWWFSSIGRQIRL